MSSNESWVGGIDASNLYAVIDKHNVHGLNLAVPEAAPALIKTWDSREDTDHYADSGVDDQLIVHVPFTQNVRVKSLLLKLGRGELTPRHLRIYVNHPTIVDFADAEAIDPQLNISLQEGETTVVEYPLRAASFASVHSLSLFFRDAVGMERSRIYYIGFRGDMRSVKREINSHLQVPAPHAADARLVDRVQDKSGARQTTAR